jgi:hypothetical protein
MLEKMCFIKFFEGEFFMTPDSQMSETKYKNLLLHGFIQGLTSFCDAGFLKVICDPEYHQKEVQKHLDNINRAIADMNTSVHMQRLQNGDVKISYQRQQ